MKLVAKLIKYLPVVLAVLMVLHCALLLAGYDFTSLRHSGMSPLVYVLMMVLSKKLGFCTWHRIILTYDFAVYVCVLLQEWNVFSSIGVHVNLMRVLMLIFGSTILTAMAVAKRYEKRC